MRIEQTIYDDIAAWLCLREIGSGIIDLNRDPGICIGLARIETPRNLNDHRIDLHRVNVTDAGSERTQDVSPSTRTHDQGPVPALGQGIRKAIVLGQERNV